MGNKFVTIDESGIVKEPYDEANGNVPEGAIAITDSEFNELGRRQFGEFSIDNGKLIVRPEIIALQYKRDRKAEYPSIEDQLDMIYWDRVNNTNEWQTLIESIKVKHPKPI